MLPYPNHQKTHARKLRREITDAEKKLWACLRDRQLCGAKFRRQHPIGSYIADFCCVESCLVIELDGGQCAEQAAADDARTKFIESRGYRVLRFWNNDVLTNLAGVVERIVEVLKSPHPCPLPKGEGGKKALIVSSVRLVKERQ
ncbi:MAG: endonuclease domain-containing protein [Deltaproteobacteria bacterium]|nr:endonuclease domain-containing protein [Deltaproteobacteria bacterium]